MSEYIVHLHVEGLGDGHKLLFWGIVCLWRRVAPSQNTALVSACKRWWCWWCSWWWCWWWCRTCLIKIGLGNGEPDSWWHHGPRIHLCIPHIFAQALSQIKEWKIFWVFKIVLTSSEMTTALTVKFNLAIWSDDDNLSFLHGIRI